MDFDHYRVRPKQKIDLKNWEPDDTRGWKGSEKAAAELAELTAKLEELQELLYCEGKHRVLVVLQGMDTSGKDGVIRKVFEGVNPQGVRVASFKVPTPIELAHDYLWRVHAQAPGKGEMVIFNRSHYEDVLVVRVHDLVPQEVWSKRYDLINVFEKMLTDSGVTILKFFLYITPEEQLARFAQRLDDPARQWKISDADYKFWLDSFNKLLASKDFLALRDQRDLYPFSMTGAELDAYVKKTVAEYRKVADEFGLIQK